MRTTLQQPPRFDLLRPRSLVVFGLLVVLALVLAATPDWEGFVPRAVARLAGYAAFVTMLVPFVHIVRRCYRYRTGWAMRFWLRLHIGAGYLALALVLVHSRGRSNGPLTLALLGLTWTVIISGVAGYFGQQLLYFLLPQIVAREFGLERLVPERDALLSEAEGLHQKIAKTKPLEVIQTFCTAAIQEHLATKFSLLGGLRRRRHARLTQNAFEQAYRFGDEQQRPLVTQLWGLVQQRRAMDLEYSLHQFGRSWLLIHGPAAWVLLVLMIEHVVLSMWYGGF